MERTNADRGYTLTPWRRNPTLQVLAGASDLARAFGLPTPAVVTNWRSRFPDFPAERIGGSQPKFSLVEVYEWLRDSGPRGRELPAISPEEWWKLLVGAFVRQADVPSPRNTLAALVLLEHLVRHAAPIVDGGEAAWRDLVAVSVEEPLAATDEPAQRLAAIAAMVERRRPDVAGLLVPHLGTIERPLDAETAGYLLDVVDAIEASPTGTARQRMRRVVATGADNRNKVEARVTTHALARLMVAAAGPSVGLTVLDPAAGEAEVLKECARRSEGLRLHGQELDPLTWAIGRARLLVADIDADLGQPGMDSIREDQHADLVADIVIVDPPVGDGAPPLDRWVEHGLRHLSPDGRLVIALPAHEIVFVAAARRKPDVRLTKVLAGLAFDGAIEGVAVLPRGFRSDITGPVAVLSIRPTLASAPREIAVVAPRVAGRGEVVGDIAAPLRRVGWGGIGAVRDDRLWVDVVDRAGVWDAVDRMATRLEETGGRGRSSSKRPAPDFDALVVAAPGPSSLEPSSGRALDGLRDRYEKVVAERDAARMEAASLRARHDLLVSSARELVEQLLLLRDDMGELHDRISYDIARVRRDLE